MPAEPVFTHVKLDDAVFFYIVLVSTFSYFQYDEEKMS